MEFKVKNYEELCNALKKSGELNEKSKIILSEGRYEIKKVLVLESNVELLGENAVLTGAKRITLDRDEKCFIDLKKHGITKFMPLAEGPYRDFWCDYEIPKPYMLDYGMGTEVFYEDKPMQIARYPKKGFMKIKEVYGFTEKRCPLGKFQGYAEGIISLKDEKFWEWDDAENVMLVGYWNNDWAIQRHTVDRIDRKKKIIYLKEPYHTFGYKKDANIYAINVKNEVTDRGDWYLDRKNGLLYIYPYENQKYIDVSVTENIFEAKNEKNIKISGITIEKCTGTGVYFEACENVEVKDCTIKNTGAWAGIAENCTRAVFDNIKAYQTGGGGLSITGGDRNTLRASESIIKNCDISEVARWHRTYLPAIQTCGVGGIVSGNKIHNVPHFGIVFHGNNHIIEKNEISNACYESNDAGAIYSGKDWSCRGNIIRNNYFHDINGFENKGCMTVYFDDALSSAEVYSNIFANISGTGILIGGGRDFKIRDNIFYNVKNPVTVDDRLENWAKGSIPKMMERLNAVDYRNDIWKNAYPELYNILEQNYTSPENNKIENNTIITKE